MTVCTSQLIHTATQGNGEFGKQNQLNWVLGHMDKNKLFWPYFSLSICGLVLYIHHEIGFLFLFWLVCVL